MAEHDVSAVISSQNLLREDGFLVVSIDDGELNNLRALLKEIFGEENFVAVLVFDRNRKNDAKLFSVGTNTWSSLLATKRC